MSSASMTAADILAVLGKEADPEAQRAMRQKYGIHTEKMFGVPMKRLLEIAKPLAPNHQLALELWDQGSYEARTIAALVDDPQQVSTQPDAAMVQRLRQLGDRGHGMFSAV